MARVLLLTLGCQRERKALDYQRESKALDSPRKSIERTTTIWASPPSAPAADTAPSVAPKSAEPEPMMTTPPPVEEVVDTPAFTPDPTPATLAPSRPPSQYRDGCGRPLVA
ncbi:MAG: hypothetical protein JRF42_09350 [Deltaproteobacteria bacterium]|nr:hypothetical protein [Deltaproteobacteria bacterium]